MRTQRETDLEDEVELLRGQLLSSYARIDELEAGNASLREALRLSDQLLREVEK